MTPKFAKLEYAGKIVKLDVIEGTEGEAAINILNLRKDTGLITMDPGYGNTGACTSAITFLDGELGILRHRGYPIEELAEHASFPAVAFLLLYGEMPTPAEMETFDRLLRAHYALDPAVLQVIEAMPAGTHPMAQLSAAMLVLSSLYPDFGKEKQDGHDLAVIRLLAKAPAIAAAIYRHIEGKKAIPADPALDYTSNFLAMMFGHDEDRSETFRKVRATSLDNLLIIHADHEQNCSTSTVRMVNSSNANIFASIAGGICALWGPLHGGANQAVMEMLEEIRKDGLELDQVIARAKDKNSGFRLMGFGHRVYKTYDPRARIAKKACDDFLANLGIKEPLVDIAMGLEAGALADEYFIKRNLYPNVDFYTGIVYRAMGIPTDMFTVLFALGRLPGWVSHVVEFAKDPERRISRPRQIYTGPNLRPLAKASHQH